MVYEEKNMIIIEQQKVKNNKQINNDISTIREENQLDIAHRKKQRQKMNAEYNKEKSITKLQKLEKQKKFLEKKK